MLGRIVLFQEKGKVSVEPERVAGLPLLRGTLFAPEGLSPRRLRRRLKKLGRLLARQGVGRLILPEGFPWGEAFADFGRVDPLPLYRAAADLLALGALELDGVPLERALVALSGPRLCPELTGTAERLCRRVRGLVIDVPGEGARYAGWLHRRYGLPVSPGAGAQVTVAFGPGGGRWGRVLELTEERLDLSGLQAAAPELDLPPEYARPLLAALWERGLLERSALQIWGPNGQKLLTNEDKVTIMP